MNTLTRLSKKSVAVQRRSSGDLLCATLAERGVTVSYETIRQWCQPFEPDWESCPCGNSSQVLNPDRLQFRCIVCIAGLRPALVQFHRIVCTS